MADKQSTLDGEDGPSDALIDLWTSLTDLLDVSQERAQSMVPDFTPEDRIRGLRYMMEDAPEAFTTEVDGETILTSPAHPLAVSFLIGEDGASLEEAMRLAHFGSDTVESVPIEVLREVAPPGSWGSHGPDPTDIPSVKCGGCDETFYDVCAPRVDEDKATNREWDTDVPTERVFVRDDGWVDSEGMIADDPSGDPYMVRDEDDDDHYYACGHCRDALLEYGNFLTVYYSGDADQAIHDGPLVSRSYIREMLDVSWMFHGTTWGREIRDSAIADRPIETELHGRFEEVSGLPDELIRAIAEDEIRPEYPVVFNTPQPTPEPRGKWHRCWVPRDDLADFESLIEQYSDDE